MWIDYNDYCKYDKLLLLVVDNEEGDFLQIEPSLTYNSFEWDTFKYFFVDGKCIITNLIDPTFIPITLTKYKEILSFIDLHSIDD